MLDALSEHHHPAQRNERGGEGQCQQEQWHEPVSTRRGRCRMVTSAGERMQNTEGLGHGHTCAHVVLDIDADRTDAGDAQPAPDLPGANLRTPRGSWAESRGRGCRRRRAAGWRRKRPDRSRSTGRRFESVRSRIPRAESCRRSPVGRNRAGLFPMLRKTASVMTGTLLSVSTNPATSTRSPTATGVA